MVFKKKNNTEVEELKKQVEALTSKISEQKQEEYMEDEEETPSKPEKHDQTPDFLDTLTADINQALENNTAPQKIISDMFYLMNQISSQMYNEGR